MDCDLKKLLRLLFQELFELGKRVMRCRSVGLIFSCSIKGVLVELGMFIVVTVEA